MADENDDTRDPKNRAAPATDVEPGSSPLATAPGYDPRHLEAAFAAVPELGKGKRWYDHAYRPLDWLITDWRRKVVPRPARVKLTYLVNQLLRFNDHDRNKVWSREDPHHAYTVPSDEHVELPTLWVVELFPPSSYTALRKAFARNKWDKVRQPGLREGNEQILDESRTGSGMYWWPMVTVINPKKHGHAFDVAREKLPHQFKSIELHAVSVGSGLTAVIAKFDLDPAAVQHLDAVWHTEHPPTLTWEKGQLRSRDPEWAGYRITQSARQAIHDAARTWMALKVPGYFATTKAPQLLLDLVLTTVLDPAGPERPPNTSHGPMRALGLTDYTHEHRTSPQLPGFLLCPIEGNMCPDMEDRNTWTLLGRKGTVTDQAGDLSLDSSDPTRALAHAIDRRIRAFLISLSLTAYTDTAKAQHAALRDNATTRNRRYSTPQLKKHRRSLLTLSLDLPGMERDTKHFWSNVFPWDSPVTFSANFAPWILARDAEAGHHIREPIDLTRHMRKRQRQDLKTLLQADTDYRDILGTVSTLGSAISTTRTGRAALSVAAASLVVSGVALATQDEPTTDQRDQTNTTTIPTPTPTPSLPATQNPTKKPAPIASPTARAR